MTSALALKLREVRIRFREAMPDRLDTLSENLHPPTPPARRPMGRIHRDLHELCGNAGMLGDGEITTCLRPALVIAENCAAEDREPSEAEMSELLRAIDTARLLADDGADDQGGPEVTSSEPARSA